MSKTLERLEEIKRQRALSAANAALSAVIVGQLLFASFAIGHAIGPSPLRRLELIAGICLSFLIGVALALPFVRRRLERGAKLKTTVREGRHKRRLLLFADHLVVDQEVVVLDAVKSAELATDRLVIRYEDPAHGGPMLRELEGDPSILERVARKAARP